MPELPEVETVRRGLSALLPGKKVAAVWHDWERGFPNNAADVEHFLIGARISEVKRRAKVLLIELDSKYSLVIHLKMTGQMVYVQPPARQKTKNKKQKTAQDNSPSTIYHPPSTKDGVRFGAGHPNDSLVNDLPDSSTRVIFDLGDSKLFFNDQRKFGWVRLLPTAEVPNIDFFRRVGPEPLAADFTMQAFRKRIGMRPGSTIKAVLLDQTVIAGVGNIYADESLFAAKIHPATRVKDVAPKKLNTLFRELRAVLELSIEKGGSSDRNYVDAEGKKGSYLSFAKVFRKEGEVCPRCGTTIVKLRVAGRGTHVCPKCQTLTGPR